MCFFSILPNRCVLPLSLLCVVFALLRVSESTNEDLEYQNEHRSDESDYETTTILPTTKEGKMKEQEIIQQILKDYDWRVRPHGENKSNLDTGGPVLVTINIYLRSISKIDDVNMEYSAQFTFRENWKDPRLAYASKFKNREVPPFVILAITDGNQPQTQQVWMPDTFFQNEKEARLSLVLSCPMSLEFYPLDHQTCLIELASYAYTTNDIKYEWKNETPVQQKEGLRKSLPSFELEDVLTGYCTSKTNTGEYSCLKTELVLRREFSYYLLQLYIPSFMLVIVSWVSFWLDKDSVPARVTLGVTTLLTMTTQSSGINAKLPPVSYTKAIDVWIGVCLAFIFGALLEFALVNYAARKDMLEPIAQRTRRSNRPKPILPVTYDSNSSFNAPVISQGQSMRVADVIADYSGTYVVNNNNNNNGGSQIGPTGQQHSLLERHRSGERQKRHKRRRRGWWENIFAKYKERSKRIDVISRLFFPVGFFIFNCIYWTVYMSK